MLDVFFISIGEANAEENYQRLLKFSPNAKRVTNVKGIYEVHRACAKLSATKNFYVVDADAWIVDDFDFSWLPDPGVKHWGVEETNCIFIWPSQNPVNGLKYGYGGVKLFPQQPFLEDRPWHIDLSTTIGSVTVVKDEISCETRFNITAESAWIAGFRECAKLASLTNILGRIQRKQLEMQQQFEELEDYIATQDWPREKKLTYRKSRKIIIAERFQAETNIYNYFGEIEKSQERMKIWTTVGWNNHNGKYAILGAQAGTQFGLKNADNIDQMKKINDWAWLASEFKNVSV